MAATPNEFTCSYTPQIFTVGRTLYWIFVALGFAGVLAFIPVEFFKTRALVFFRVCAFVSVAGALLSDRLLYTNHHYLLALYLGLLIFSPSFRAPRPDVLWLLRFVWVLPYGFSALSKVLDSGWFSGAALTPPAHYIVNFLPWINPWILAVWLAALIVVFDITIPTLFIARRKWRHIGLLLVFSFHIGSLPLLSIEYFSILMIGGAFLWFVPLEAFKLSQRAKVLVASFVLIQLALPLRPYLLTRDPNWTEESTEFSWRMLNNLKSVNQFSLKQDGQSIPWADYFSPYRATRFVRSPECILQFSKRWFEQRPSQAQVTGQGTCSMNNSLYQKWIPSGLDLSQATIADWTPSPSQSRLR
jgi:hypothetical protein